MPADGDGLQFCHVDTIAGNKIMDELKDMEKSLRINLNSLNRREL